MTTLGARQTGQIAPSFLPDGRRFLFFQRGGLDGAGIYLGALDANAPTQLAPAAGSGVWLPSGWLLWVRAGTQTLVAQRLDAGKAALTGEPVTVADGVGVDANLSAVSVAASGLVAYQQLNESGASEVYVRPFVAPGAADTVADVAGSQWQVSTAGGSLPVWRPDGEELYYVDLAGAMMAAPIRVVGTTLEPGTPTVLFPTRIVSGGGGPQIGRNYDVAPDGRFLIKTELPGDAAPITLIQNWQGGLAAREKQ